MSHPLATGYIEYTKVPRRRKKQLVEGTLAAEPVITTVPYPETQADGSSITKRRFEPLFKSKPPPKETPNKQPRPKETLNEMQVDAGDVGNENQYYDNEDLPNNSPPPRKHWVSFLKELPK
jgi:hypothetical protein